MLSVVAAVLVALAPPPSTGWVWPLPGPPEVLAGFAPPAHNWLPGHRGVDLLATSGEGVVAAGAGRISFAGHVGGVAVVAIRHPDGLETTYEPVAAGVPVGRWVAAGGRIGTIAGRLAHCRSVCLHWGLRRNGSYLDPLALVGEAQVRLLPLLSGDGPPAAVAPTFGAVALVASGTALARRRRRISRGRR